MKKWYIYIMKYYSAIERIYIAIWMDPEIVILSEVRERQISYDINYIWNIKKGTNELM